MGVLDVNKQRYSDWMTFMTTQVQISDELLAFVQQAPVVRAPHLAFMQEAAASTGYNQIVLDVGSGTAPFRELFVAENYVRLDWNHSIYDSPIDVRASATTLPFVDSCIGAVLCTEVLEHLSEPAQALREIHRVLRPGCRMWLTTPFVWPLHEEPYDYYRYTSHGLRYLLEQAGFEVDSVAPLSDSLSTLRQMLMSVEWLMGSPDDGYNEHRGLVARMLESMAGSLEVASNYDSRWVLPVGYRAIARRPT